MRNFRSSGTKYNSRKVERDGMTFDSVKEYRRFCELSLLEKAGKITELKRQVKCVLIPAQYEPDTIGSKGGVKRGKLIERECSYVADFTYTDSNGKFHIEDVKGYKGGGAYAVFTIKRKLMLHVHGIKIEEV